MRPWYATHSSPVQIAFISTHSLKHCAIPHFLRLQDSGESGDFSASDALSGSGFEDSKDDHSKKGKVGAQQMFPVLEAYIIVVARRRGICTSANVDWRR